MVICIIYINNYNIINIYKSYIYNTFIYIIYINNYLKCKWIQFSNQKKQTGWLDTETRAIYMLSTNYPRQTQGHIETESERLEKGKFSQRYREELAPILLKLFQTCRGRETPKLILWGHHHPDTKTRQRYHKKENHSPISQMNIDVKILNKVLENRIQQYIKRIIHHD